MVTERHCDIWPSDAVFMESINERIRTAMCPSLLHMAECKRVLVVGLH